MLVFKVTNNFIEVLKYNFYKIIMIYCDSIEFIEYSNMYSIFTIIHHILMYILNNEVGVCVISMLIEY